MVSNLTRPPLRKKSWRGHCSYGTNLAKKNQDNVECCSSMLMKYLRMMGSPGSLFHRRRQGDRAAHPLLECPWMEMNVDLYIGRYWFRDREVFPDKFESIIRSAKMNSGRIASKVYDTKWWQEYYLAGCYVSSSVAMSILTKCDSRWFARQINSDELTSYSRPYAMTSYWTKLL